MTNIYNDDDYAKIKEQKKKVLTIYFVVVGIIFALILTAMIFYWGLPYKSNYILLTKIVVFVILGLFIIFSCIYLGIKYKRVKNYYKMLGYINIGLKENNQAEFIRFEDTIEVKEFVDFSLLIFSEWNAKKEEFYERKVLMDREKELPKIESGQVVRFLTQGNIIIAYEIVDTAEGDNK